MSLKKPVTCFSLGSVHTRNGPQNFLQEIGCHKPPCFCLCDQNYFSHWPLAEDEDSQSIQLWSTWASKIEDLKSVQLQDSCLCHNFRQPTSLVAVCDNQKVCNNVPSANLPHCSETDWKIVCNLSLEYCNRWSTLNWISWCLFIGQEGILAMHL